MTELKVFNYENADVRTVQQDSEVWWVLKDVCDVLEIVNSRDAALRLDEDEKDDVGITDAIGRQQNTTVINESGLYSTILLSRKPEAKKFKRWVTHEVLPSIRKTGMYATDDLLANPDLAIQAFTALKREREKTKSLQLVNAQQKQIIAEYSPKVSYYDLILQTKDTLSASQIAKDYGMSAKWLNQKLYDLGVQYKQGDVWLLYQKHAGNGYTQSKTHQYCDSSGVSRSKLHTYYTQKGRLFIYELLKKHDILPEIEREVI